MGLEIKVVLDLLLAAACGAALGLEREIQRKPAGLRTNMLIGLGAALFTYCSQSLFSLDGQRGDPARIAAQIVVGIGFIGAGTIMRHNDQVTGLTSAATVWVVAAIGILAGAHRPLMAICGTAIALVILHLLTYVECMIVAQILNCRAELVGRDRDGLLSEIEGRFRGQRIVVQDLSHAERPDGRMDIKVQYHTTRRRHARMQQQLATVAGLEEVRTRVL